MILVQKALIKRENSHIKLLKEKHHAHIAKVLKVGIHHKIHKSKLLKEKQHLFEIQDKKVTNIENKRKISGKKALEAAKKLKSLKRNK